MATLGKITPCLWFDTRAEEAAKFYVGIFENSKIIGISHYNEAGPRPAGEVLTVAFELEGHPFTALNGGPEFTFDEAISFQVRCDDQAEADRLWSALTAGGAESQCGWLKDKFGLSWQIIPTELEKLISDPDAGRASRAMKAMLGMKKIDIEAMRRAADDAS